MNKLCRFVVKNSLTVQEVNSIKTMLATRTQYLYINEDWFKSEPDKYYYVLYKRNQVVGVYSCLAQQEKNAIYGRGILISPQFRGQGYGTFIMKLVIEDLKNRHPGFIFKITIHPENIASLKLMLKIGFKIYGFIPDFLNTGQPRLKLSLNL